MASSLQITYYSRCKSGSGCSSCSSRSAKIIASPDSDLEDSAASPLRRNGRSDCSDNNAPDPDPNAPLSPKHEQQTRYQKKSHDFPINVFSIRNGQELPTPTPSIEENVHMHRVRRLHSFPIHVYSIYDMEELPTPTPSIEDDQYYNGVDQVEEGDEYSSPAPSSTKSSSEAHVVVKSC